MRRKIDILVPDFLGRDVARGRLVLPTDDRLAEMYEHTRLRLADRGYEQYEISNWARSPADRCRHNLLYWTGGDWWGLGPGAHSHVGGVRWWNVKHPSAYARRLSDGVSPGHGRELLTAALSAVVSQSTPAKAALDDAARRANQLIAEKH